AVPRAAGERRARASAVPPSVGTRRRRDAAARERGTRAGARAPCLERGHGSKDRQRPVRRRAPRTPRDSYYHRSPVRRAGAAGRAHGLLRFGLGLAPSYGARPNRSLVGPRSVRPRTTASSSSVSTPAFG